MSGSLVGLIGFSGGVWGVEVVTSDEDTIARFSVVPGLGVDRAVETAWLPTTAARCSPRSPRSISFPYQSLPWSDSGDAM